MLTLTNSSAVKPTITPSATTYEINSATSVTLTCASDTAGVTFQWKKGSTDMLVSVLLASSSLVIPSLITHIIHRSSATSKEYVIPNDGDGGAYICTVTETSTANTAESDATTITATGSCYFTLLKFMT